MLFVRRAAPEVILVVALTNLAVINLANAIFETACFMEVDLIFLQSLTAEKLYPNGTMMHRICGRSQGYRSFSICSICSTLDAAQRPFVEKYLEKRLPRTRRGDDEVERSASRWIQCSLGHGTIAMTERFYGSVWQNMTYVICDKAGQVS